MLFLVTMFRVLLQILNSLVNLFKILVILLFSYLS